jgi:hypothetical protein
VTEYHKLISTLFQEGSFLGIDHLSPFISKFIFKKAGSKKSAALGISGIEYQDLEKFLSEYGIQPTKKLKEIIEELCTYNEFGIDLNDVGSSISFYFEAKNNSQFIPKSYKKMLPSGATEDGIKITYDIGEDRIVYLKSYCIFIEKMLTDRKNAFRNFGFLVDENEKPSLTITQTCVHRNVRNVEHVESNMKSEYEKLTKLGFKTNMTAIREGTGQSYLYITRSL